MADPAIRVIVAKAGGDVWRAAAYALRREQGDVHKGQEIQRLNRALGRANRRRRNLHRKCKRVREEAFDAALHRVAAICTGCFAGCDSAVDAAYADILDARNDSANKGDG